MKAGIIALSYREDISLTEAKTIFELKTLTNYNELKELETKDLNLEISWV